MEGFVRKRGGEEGLWLRLGLEKGERETETVTREGEKEGRSAFSPDSSLERSGSGDPIEDVFLVFSASNFEDELVIMIDV